jgi:hypothetical protein
MKRHFEAELVVGEGVPVPNAVKGWHFILRRSVLYLVLLQDVFPKSDKRRGSIRSLFLYNRLRVLGRGQVTISVFGV